MSLSNAAENAISLLIFNATAWADVAENDTTSPITTWDVALHTAWPGEAGDQSTNECAYTNYARQTPARTSGGFTVTGGQTVNAATITFPESGSSETAYFWSLGTGVANFLLLTGILQPSGGGALGPAIGDTDDSLIIKGHGLIADDRVVFLETPGLSIPTGITEGTVYWVKTAPDADTITISATQGGATVDITADGAARAYKVQPLNIESGVQPKFNAGELVCNLF